MPQTIATPPFLAWTLAWPCPLKQFDGWQNPERVERHLRSAREYGEAMRTGRYDQRRCYDNLSSPIQYFDIAETLQLYGGGAAVSEACSGCPANALEKCLPGSLAGCYGEVPLPEPAAEFYDAVDRAALTVDASGIAEHAFPLTTPRWFGFWLRPIQAEAARFLRQVLGSLSTVAQQDHWQLLLHALGISTEGRAPLYARHYPGGTIEGRRWRLGPYCVHCHAEIADYRRACEVCGELTRQIPSLVRHLRGNRPWRKLI